MLQKDNWWKHKHGTEGGRWDMKAAEEAQEWDFEEWRKNSHRTW